MDNAEIIKTFLQKGVLLTPEALSYLATQENINAILESKHDKTILTQNDLIPKQIEIEEPDKFRIIKNLTSKPKEIGTEDFISFYTSKYEKMKKLLTERLSKNFVSLNKLDSFRSEVHVIGLVKELKEKNGKKVVELEDLTTTVPILFDDIGDLELDDVVAVSAISAGKVMFGKKILYPDMPLRQPARGYGKACFISDLHLEESPTKDIEAFFSWFEKQDLPALFIAGDTGDLTKLEELINQHCYGKQVFIIPGNADKQEEYPQLPLEFNNKNIISTSNPSIIEFNGVKILLIHHAEISMLKKRYLGKSHQILPEDFLVLDEIPDIVHCGHTHEPFITNYKSVTLVNSGSLLADFRPVVIDLASREAIQIKIPEA
ncbi:MAG: metallophosphoesterase family protein [Candidatus Aenigmarchaeota archaeon]|nr:metallophosphoesterase family protein [Candidatus Aenigmarchaeota archaeon]